MKFLSFIFLIAIPFFNFTCAINVSPKCHPEESSSLLQFKASFVVAVDSQTSFPCSELRNADTSTWSSVTDCCDWDGITCDESTGNVVGLDLRCGGLKGSIRSDDSRDLFSLSHLESLDLSFNDFSGSPIPPRLGNFRNLTRLDLSGANFTGKVPPEIASLSKLVSFSLAAYRGDPERERVSVGASVFEALARNMTELRELKFVNIDMSEVPRGAFMGLSSSLTNLSLSSCSLNGELPETTFERFSKLQNLRLGGNNFNGVFPWSSLNLENLSELDLSYNNFSGQLPQVYNSDKFSRNASSGLVTLDLSRNSFNGEIPPWIFEHRSLVSLNLENNLFTGELGEFRTPSLQRLSVGNNKLRGRIPDSIFRIATLESLDLSSNKFAGDLEAEKMSELRDLSSLDLSWNNLTLTFDGSDIVFEKLRNLALASCNITEFPKFLESSKRLETLDLSSNRIRGSLPNWFGEVGKDSLFQLNLSHNSLTSLQPLSWKTLQILDLRNNSISGPLSLSSLPLLRIFLASENRFSGSIPDSICEMKSLEMLHLSDSNLSGEIPRCLGNFSENLSIVNLRNNRLRGEIPNNFSRRNILRNLNLNGNRLEGSLPSSLAYCESLEVLDVGNNMINDTFQSWLETLPRLRVLVLRANRFHGPIGVSKISSPFRELQIVDLSRNYFEGSLPAKYFESFEAMIDAENDKMGYMEGNYYLDSVNLTMKGYSVWLMKIQTMLTIIDFSDNRFSGEIPESIGRLKSLKGLILSHNRLSGSIPSSLGNLRNLEWLDLSYNELFGEIPSELLDINWLSFLNLSYNNLQGPIPVGKQFDTFDNDSYSGNLGLCGVPLTESCYETREDRRGGGDNGGTGKEIVLKWTVVMIGYAGGLVIGVSIGYMVLFTARFDYWLMERVGEGIRRKTNKARFRVRRRN